MNKKFICPCCGQQLRYEEWVTMRLAFNEFIIKSKQSKNQKH